MLQLYPYAFFCRITVETNMDDGYDGYKKSIGSLTESWKCLLITFYKCVGIVPLVVLSFAFYSPLDTLAGAHKK